MCVSRGLASAGRATRESERPRAISWRSLTMTPYPLGTGSSRHAAALDDRDLSVTTGRVLLSESDSPAAKAFIAVGAFDLGPTPLRVDRNTPEWFELTNFYGLGNGTNLAFRRNVFTNGWGFAEWLGHGSTMMSEDHYALFTLVRDGHSVAYLPEAVVFHDPPRSP